jgi:hypothetical protein
VLRACSDTTGKDGDSFVIVGDGHREGQGALHGVTDAQLRGTVVTPNVKQLTIKNHQSIILSKIKNN